MATVSATVSGMVLQATISGDKATVWSGSEIVIDGALWDGRKIRGPECQPFGGLDVAGMEAALRVLDGKLRRALGVEPLKPSRRRW